LVDRRRKFSGLVDLARIDPLSLVASQLPVGVSLRTLDRHHDRRGVFAEVFRVSWGLNVAPIQWNVVHSVAGVLRGVHVHPIHDDYFTVASGLVSVGLCDLRPGSPTAGLGVTLGPEVTNGVALTIPSGVAHGFYFHEASIGLYAVSEYWDPADELGCHWADAALGLAWPCVDPILSERDALLGPLGTLSGQIPAFRPAP
jgi:dTDP-4-dehydrorhamnose 3,5-epimerase